MTDPAESPETQVAFLENEPPPLVARGLALLLIALFVTAAILASVIHLPETVRATFVLVPIRGNDPIRAPRAGRVVEAQAVESARVRKDAPLFVLRSPEAADRAADLQVAEAKEQSAAQGLVNARRKYQSETLSAAEEMRELVERSAFLDRMLVLKQEQLALTAEQAERARILRDQGLASLDMQSDMQIRHSATIMELEQLRTDRRETLAKIEKLRHSDDGRRAAFEEEERTLLEQLGEARIRVESLRADLPVTGAGEITIASPCDGTIVKLEVRGEGAIVQEGDTLAEVACSGEKLQAELTVPQGALSRIRPGQPVKLLYEAFPYQRFGVKRGIVRWASPAGTAGSPGAAPSPAAPGTSGTAPAAARDPLEFRAFAQLVEEGVRVDGEDRRFLPGMTGSALVVVGRRSVISYAFDPLRQMREALR